MRIVDETLFPYEIAIDGSNYTVEELTDKVTSKGENIYRNHGYFSTFETSLSKIISLKMIDSKVSVTLRDYLYEYRTIKDQIKESIKF